MSFKVPSTKPYFPKEDVEELKKHLEIILGSGMLTLGEYTNKLESEFSKIHGTKFSVAVSSGTSALEIIFRALGLTEDDEVIAPTNTFGATVTSIIFAGAKPIIADVEKDTLCLDPASVRKKLSERTKAIVTVHIGGLIAPSINELREIASDNNLFLVEDAAHAHGSSFNGRKAGSFGVAGAFSFYPTKVIATSEGGIITTGSEDIRGKARIMRDQGKENFSSNVIVELGYNWRMNEVSAAICLSQLARLDEFVRNRNRIARIYDEELGGVEGIAPQVIPAGCVSNYYKYTAFLDKGISRDAFKKACRERGVSLGGEVYWPPIHMQPIFSRLLNLKEGLFPNSEDVCRRIVSLPMYSNMREEEAAYAADVMKRVLREMLQAS
jgi:perosamine synthetase